MNLCIEKSLALICKLDTAKGNGFKSTHVQDLKKLSSFKTPYKVLLCIDFLCMVLRAFFAK